MAVFFIPSFRLKDIMNEAKEEEKGKKEDRSDTRERERERQK